MADFDRIYTRERRFRRILISIASILLIAFAAYHFAKSDWAMTGDTKEVEIDGCEYIKTYGSQNVTLIHKENCSNHERPE